MNKGLPQNFISKDLLQKFIVEVCNLSPENLFEHRELVNDVVYWIKQRLHKRCESHEAYLELVKKILSEIDEMVKDKKLVIRDADEHLLQTPENLLTHHGCVVPKE